MNTPLDKLGIELVDGYLGNLNSQFYYDRPKKAFFWDRSLLIQAIQTPALWLESKGITREFPVEKYRAVLDGIIHDIKQHGDTANIAHFGRYFLRCVQDHMKHQGDRYYEESVAARNCIANIAAGILSKQKAPKVDQTIQILAAAAKVARQKRLKKKKDDSVPQLDLFASSAPAGSMQRLRR